MLKSGIKRRKIIRDSWIIVALSIVLVGGLLFFFNNIGKNVEQRTYMALSETAEIQKTAIKSKFDAQFMVLDALAATVDLTAGLMSEEVVATLASAVQTTDFSALLVADTEGNAHMSDGTSALIYDRDYFRAAITGQRIVSEVVVSRTDGSNSVVIAIPLYRDNIAEVQGVLCGVYHTGDLAEAVIVDSYQGEGHTLIVAQDGSLITASSSTAAMYEGMNILEYLAGNELDSYKAMEEIRADMSSGASDTLFYFMDDKGRYTTYIPLGLNEWYVFCSVTESSVVSEYAFITRNLFGLYALVIVSFLLLLGYVIVTNRRQTRQIHQEKEMLRISEERYRILTERSESIIFEYVVKDASLFVSPRFAEALKRSPETYFFGAMENVKDFVHPDDIEALLEFSNTLLRGENVEVDVRFIMADGSYQWHQIIGTVIFDDHGHASRIIGEMINIDDAKRTSDILLQKARTDPLTGLLNKTTTEEEINDFLLMTRQRGIHAMLIIDMDNFKDINDNYGHMVGDAALLQAAHRLMKVFRTTDIVGRIGGDEFIVLLKDVHNETMLRGKAQQLNEEMKLDLEVRGHKIYVSCSIGIAMAPHDGQRFAELYEKADKALYAAKHSGRDRYVVYDQDMKQGEKLK
ncbi:MAG: diguanylate cyclase [Syntrophomonadaceae bacterium]|nr:diguanylate cyclase [Syntrophomonadaceae bacterium]